MMRSPGVLVRIGAVLLPLGLASCVGAALELARGEPPRLYDLTPKSTFAPNLPAAKGRLSVETPTAVAGLNTAKIALKPTPTRLEYYARARWVDVVPVMIQTHLLESFDNSGQIDVLGRSAYGLRADLALLTTVREFQAEYQDSAAPPEVHVRLEGRLVGMPRRNTLAETSTGAKVRAADTSMAAIVTAFDEAFGRATKQLVEWTVQAAAQADVAAQ
jgi:cholesterol transport system auxiliary component